MRVLLMMMIVWASSSLSAQKMSDGVVLDTMTSVHYIEVMGYSSGIIKKKVVPIVDYGQRIKMNTGAAVVDDKGEPMEFNSVAGILNYLYGKGWVLVQSFAVYDGIKETVYHHLLSRK
jgi:hypothetical protein